MQDSLSRLESEEEQVGAAEALPETKPTPRTYRIIAGLLWQDRFVLPLFYWLLVLPQILHLAGFELLSISVFSLLILERAMQLIFLTWLTNRWLKILSRGEKKVAASDTLRFILIGFVAWLALFSPLLAQISSNQREIQLIALAMLAPYLYLLNKYFFYFFPILCGVRPGKQTLISAASINGGDQLMPLRSIAAPAGYFLLIFGLISAISPDGRLMAVEILATIFGGVFWTLHCYVSLGFALVFWNERDWRNSKLDPYRQARLTTIALSGPEYLGRLLTPKNGLSALLVSALIWSANQIRLETSPPAAQIKLVSTSVNNDEVTVKLEIEDKEFKFRGLQPMAFNLAGEQGAEVSRNIESVQSDGKDVLLGIAPDNEKTELVLVFKTLRSGEALTNLQDLYLWYRHAKLFKIDLSASGTKGS